MQVSIVCPFFNEEIVIAEVVRSCIDRLHHQLDCNWELILVNDGSTDNSVAALTGALTDADRQHVRVIGYAKNQGRGHALKTGIDAATGDIIVTTEADGSWGEDIVPRLAAVLMKDSQADAVVASVHMPGGGLVNVTPRRVLLTKAANILIRAFISRDYTMYTGMTRAYRREVIQPLPITEYGKEFHLESLLKLHTLGFDIREIPATITWPQRKAKGTGKKRTSSTNIPKTIMSHLRFAILGKPSQYFAIAALAAFLAGSAFMMAAVWELLTHGVAINYALTALLLWIVGLLFTGFSAIFTHLRDILRGQWAAAYPALPPTLTTARKVRTLFPLQG
ncbi:MAG: glycosyltransferase family 2 protein [Alphaproteobacteria bacterium]|nr:glycosyltransferase family 2 protein [Alphaproteobacteria bacterium]